MRSAWDRRGVRHGSLVAAALLLVLVVALSAGWISHFAHGADRAQEAQLVAMLRRAVVACYAIEGRYPPSLSYIESEYGVRVDERRFIVHYEIFAANVFPNVSVIAKGDGA